MQTLSQSDHDNNKEDAVAYQVDLSRHKNAYRKKIGTLGEGTDGLKNTYPVSQSYETIIVIRKISGWFRSK